MSSLRQPSSWLLAGSGLILYLWAPMLLAGEDLGAAAGAVPSWVPVVAPPLLYALLVLGLPGVPATRRLAGLAVLSAVHAVLGLLTPAIHAAAGLGPAPHAFDPALWASPAVPVIQLLSAPLAVFPLRELLVRPRRRRGRRGGSAVGIAPTPTPMRPGRGWDDVTQHTVGGERLREEGTGAQVTPEWRRPRREPTRPVSPPTEAAPSAAPASPPAPPAAPILTSTPETPPVVEAPAPGPWSRAASPAPERLEPVASRIRLEEPIAPVAAEPLRSPDVVPAPPLEHVARPDEPVTPPVQRAVLSVEPVVSPPGPAALPVEPVALPGPLESTAAALPTTTTAAVGPAERPKAQAASPPVPLEIAATAPPPIPAELAAPPPAARTPEAAPRAEDTIDGARVKALLAPVGPLEVESQTLMGIALFTACSPRLAKDAVLQAAFRFLSFLAESPGAQPVTQTTIRGGVGALVLTPLGPLATGGPVLAAAIPQRGALALLEILSLRIATEYPATRAALAVTLSESPRPDARPSPLAEAPVPPRVELLARSLTAGGPLRPLCFEGPTGRLLLYLLVGPDVDAKAIGAFALDLYRVMEVDDEPGGVGPFQSVVVRLGSQRVVIRPVAPNPECSTLLVTAGPSDGRPGLARLQLERVAGRLALPPA